MIDIFSHPDIGYAEGAQWKREDATFATNEEYVDPNEASEPLEED